MSEKQYQYDLDAMKAVTILLVVLAHITRMFSPVGVVKIAMESSFYTVITEFIYMFHMPAFVSITGAVYYYVRRSKSGYTNQKKFIFNKFKRLVIPYVFFALFVVLPTLMFIGLENNIIDFLIKNILLFRGPNHLWYSIMIFNIFILFSFIEKKVFSAPFFVNLGIMLFLYGIGSQLTFYFQVNGTFSYLIYFYLGYVFQQHKKKFEIYFPSNVLLIFSFIFTVIIFFLNNYVFFKLNVLLRVFGRIIGAIIGTVLIYLISYRVGSSTSGRNTLINTLAKDSYGIYLFHPMLIYILFYIVKDKTFNVNIAVLVFLLIVMLTSINLVKLFRRLKLHILIGERLK